MDDFFSLHQHVDVAIAGNHNAFARAIAVCSMNMPAATVLPSSPSTPTATPPPSAAAFAAVPPTALDPWLNDPDTLILDVRPSGAYASARVPGAVSVSAPSTLLKRPSVPLRSLSNMLPPRSAKRFSTWPSAKRIMVYDADAAAIPENSNIFGLLRKFQNDGFKGEMAWLRGGFHSVWRERKELVDTNPPTPDAEDDDSPESSSHQAQSSILRPRLLSSTAFTLSSTLLGNSPHPSSKRGPLMLRNAQPSSSSAHHPAANPFFDTIRQNVELSHGITERIPLQLPRRVRRRLDDLNFVPWLQRIAKLAGRSTPHTHPLPSDASSEDDTVAPSSGDHYADALANQFYQIELAEQRRLMNIMQHHSQESGVVVVEGNKETKSNEFPYSITAGVEKGAKNRYVWRFPFVLSEFICPRYRHIWPFEHARVKLQAKDDDYVNASHVQPLFTNKRYIATQGPLPATYVDFWT
jgi:protein-tyrosine phosphatase